MQAVVQNKHLRMNFYNLESKYGENTERSRFLMLVLKFLFFVADDGKLLSRTASCSTKTKEL